MVIAQGLFMYCINYLLVYYASGMITSGLIAVVFSLIVLTNALFERLFFGTPLEPRLVIASAFGMAGIALIFWPEISELSLRDKSVAGLLIGQTALAAPLGLDLLPLGPGADPDIFAGLGNVTYTAATDTLVVSSRNGTL